VAINIMRIYLVRHGITLENIRGTTNGGAKHGTLSKKGIKQAKAVAVRLKSKKIAAIYSSDLKRASDTAGYIARFHRVPVYHTRALREWDYGPFEGHRFSDEAWDALREMFYSPGIKVRGVESLSEVHVRVRKFMAKAQKRHKGETVVFVSHSGVGRVITAAARSIPISRAGSIPRLKNTGVRYLKMNEE
jgi:broad specificity phosphatase PhoE